MYKGLKSIKQLDISFKTIVDVGAAAGTWTKLAKRLWPECSYLLFEPLVERIEALERLANQYSDIYIVPYAAGATTSDIHFFVTADLDGSWVTQCKHPGASVRLVKQAAIDNEIKVANLTGPYLIKLDTHGYEVPIIEGCKEILSDVSVFVIECYGFQIADNSLLFWEMCEYMDNLGFRLFNVVDQMNRPKDNALWQCDAFFIRKEHKLFSNTDYN